MNQNVAQLFWGHWICVNYDPFRQGTYNFLDISIVKIKKKKTTYQPNTNQLSEAFGCMTRIFLGKMLQEFSKIARYLHRHF